MKRELLQFWKHPPSVQLAVVMPRSSKRGIKHGAHSHRFHELGFLIEGECDWHIAGKQNRLRAGDLILVPSGSVHHEETPASAQARIGWIGFVFSDGFTDVPTALSMPLAAGIYASEFARLFNVVRTEREVDAPGHLERAEWAFREVLILFCRLLPAVNSPAVIAAKSVGKTKTSARSERKTPRTPQAERGPQLVQSAALTLSGNLSQPLRIRDLASYHSLSPSHFALLFRQHQGETPRRFLQNARLARAKTLLGAGELNVKEIAAACGYVDAAHFCHAFKTATKLTPKQFRKRGAV